MTGSDIVTEDGDFILGDIGEAGLMGEVTIFFILIKSGEERWFDEIGFPS